MRSSAASRLLFASLARASAFLCSVSAAAGIHVNQSPAPSGGGVSVTARHLRRDHAEIAAAPPPPRFSRYDLAPDRPRQPRAYERGGGGAGKVDDEPGREERLCARRDHAAMAIGSPRDCRE